MAIRKTEAFVLKAQPFRSSSLIVTVFSRDFGKIKAVAKGVRQEGAGRPSAFEPFTLLEIIFYEKLRSDLHLLSEYDILETFYPLRQRLETLAAAYYFTEMVEQLTELHDPHEKLFDLLHFAFENLPSVPVASLVRHFEIRLLLEIGLLPHLDACLVCGEKPAERIYFSPGQGGVLCLHCSKKYRDARLLKQEAWEGMVFFARESDPGKISKEHFSETALKEISGQVERFLRERVGKKFSTRRFLGQVEALSVHEAQDDDQKDQKEKLSCQ